MFDEVLPMETPKPPQLTLAARCRRAWKELPLGPQRVLKLAYLVALVVPSFLAAADKDRTAGRAEAIGVFFGTMLGIGIAFPAIVLVLLWIYRGFTKTQ